MPALTSIGIVHTAISLVAVASGAMALIRNRKIEWNSQVGKTYVISTILTCLTGFFIFQHGGFGKPHALGIITLVVLLLAMVAGMSSNPLGKWSAYISTIAYTTTFFFHLVPGITETATRLPVEAPLAAGPDDPGIQKAVGICFLLFLIGVTSQVRAMRKKDKTN